MSELAFDAGGDPVTFPAEAEELRVRRFRSPGMRGACEVVHDRDGAPLYISVDTGYVEFRALVGGVPGRYRLDPVDAGRRVIPNTVAAYLTITEPSRNISTAGAIDERDSVIRELARANAEMAKTIADRFANVMQAAADLLRAADGAGLPRREPPQPVEPDVEEEDDSDLDDGEGSPDFASLIAQLLPMAQMWFATKAAEKAAATAPAAAPTPTPVPAPMAAPPAAPVTMAGEGGAVAGLWADTPDAVATGPDVHSREVPNPGDDAIPSTKAAVPADVAARDLKGRNAQAAQPDWMGHLLVIYAGLTPDERRIAQLVVGRMSAEVRAQWLAELAGLTVEQAIALVRSMIPRTRRRSEADSRSPAANHLNATKQDAEARVESQGSSPGAGKPPPPLVEAQVESQGSSPGAGKPPPPPVPARAPAAANPLATLGGLDIDKALELLIGRLQAALPQEKAAAKGPSPGVRIQFVPMPKRR